jgi:hypothetical protein
MTKINFLKAYYIKLGRSNIWAEDSIINNKIRIGWKNQSLNGIQKNYQI